MRKIILAIILALTLQAAAQDKLVPVKDFSWPESPSKLTINGVELPCEWIDGRPRALKVDVERLMHAKIEGGDRNVDCIDAFGTQNYQVRRGHAGEIDVRNPDSASASVIQPHSLASSASSSGIYSRSNSSGRRISGSSYSNSPGRPVSGASLTSQAVKYESPDTGYLRAIMRITNTGSRTSPSCIAVGVFQDYFGHPVTRCKMPLRSLRPGESEVLTFFSHIEATEAATHPNGLGDKWECKPRYETDQGGKPAGVTNADNPFRSNSTTFESGRVTDGQGRVITPGGLNRPGTFSPPPSSSTPSLQPSQQQSIPGGSSNPSSIKF